MEPAAGEHKATARGSLGLFRRGMSAWELALITRQRQSAERESYHTARKLPSRLVPTPGYCAMVPASSASAGGSIMASLAR